MRKALFTVGAILAAAAATAAPFVAGAITVGPTRLEYSANPGDVITGQLFLENEQPQPATFYSSFQSFTESDGGRNFVNADIGLPTWIHTSSSVALAPGAQTYVPFTIDVPNNAPPGGQYAVIWWSSSPPSGSGVGVVSRAGILVYLTVSGNITESAGLNGFSAPSALYWSSDPIPVNLSFTDTGNTYLKPGGTVDLVNIFGVTQASAQVNGAGVDFLPQGTKGLQTMTLNPPYIVFGPYRIIANVTYGVNDDKTATATMWVWIFPWQLIIWVVVFLLIVFLVLPKGIRSYNRWIIEKSKSAS